MDSMGLEKEKGITIIPGEEERAAWKYKNFHVNIAGTSRCTPTGGEVERIVNMIGTASVLVVDSAEGLRRAQTRFVLTKALRRRRAAR